MFGPAPIVRISCNNEVAKRPSANATLAYEFISPPSPGGVLTAPLNTCPFGLSVCNTYTPNSLSKNVGRTPAGRLSPRVFQVAVNFGCSSRSGSSGPGANRNPLSDNWSMKNRLGTSVSAISAVGGSACRRAGAAASGSIPGFELMTPARKLRSVPVIVGRCGNKTARCQEADRIFQPIADSIA